MMIVKITSKRQVTFPVRVLDALCVETGDRLELHEGPEGITLKPMPTDYSRPGTLHGKIRRGTGRFDLQAFREQPYAPALRD